MRGGSFRAGQQETWPARNLSCCPVFSSEDAAPVSLPPTFDSATSESGTKISPSPAAVTSIARVTWPAGPIVTARTALVSPSTTKMHRICGRFSEMPSAECDVRHTGPRHRSAGEPAAVPAGDGGRGGSPVEGFRQHRLMRRRQLPEGVGHKSPVDDLIDTAGR